MWLITLTAACTRGLSRRNDKFYRGCRFPNCFQTIWKRAQTPNGNGSSPPFPEGVFRISFLILLLGVWKRKHSAKARAHTNWPHVAKYSLSLPALVDRCGPDRGFSPRRWLITRRSYLLSD
jgi:hypothetical protein